MRVTDDTSRLPYLLWSHCLSVSRECLPYLNLCCCCITSSQTQFPASWSTTLHVYKAFPDRTCSPPTPLPAISVSLFFRLSSGVGNMPELPHCCSGNPNPSTHVTFCPPINEDQSQSRGSGLPVRREGRGRGQEQEAHSPARPRSCNQANQRVSLG